MSSVPFRQARFEYLNKLGEGGLGRVDKIKIIESKIDTMPVGSEWACKRLNDKWKEHSVMQQRFEREIEALKRMSHPNIVTCEAENIPNDERKYVMPLFTSNIQRLIHSGQTKNNWVACANYCIILAKALQYAHDMGFIHRDLKPDNVLFSGGGQLKIADWGLGYFVHKQSKVLQQLTRGGMGTEYYCSMEQWNTGKCDRRGDVYSLGIVLDEMINGGQRTLVVGCGIQTDCINSIDSATNRINILVKRMTALRREQRPSSMKEVADELNAIVDLAKR